MLQFMKLKFFKFRYRNNTCFLDVTYKTIKYDLPVFPLFNNKCEAVLQQFFIHLSVAIFNLFLI